ncbi:carboxypeptidase-like regulatory domain-containing protein [Puia sp. P3]|uniref:carboxypeptidase-like regulatory domain-containing protein n=1 Tax=Puia sp. P3 TaxID=3423952 RepID=UPI003D6749E2
MRTALAACKRSADYCQKDGTGLVAVRVKATIASFSLAMRLTAAILLIGALHVHARGVAQKVSITGTNLPLSTVFHAIEDQTGYGVLMEKSTLQAAKPVSISLTNGTIDDVMKVCFSFQPWKLTYTISGKTISISKIQSTTGNLPLTNAPEIAGIVRNDEGAPLAGATIEIKGLNKRGQTNEKGEFTLKNVPNGKYSVEISFVGYEKFVTEVKVEDNVFRLFAELKRSTNILDQTQVIAYGTTTQRFSTGNVTTVKGADIEKQPVNNPLLALEGRSAWIVHCSVKWHSRWGDNRTCAGAE